MEFKPYNPAEIEPKWQKHWDDNQTFAATNDYSKPKFYGLIEFPYPSGNGLHVGHPRSNTAMDIISRKRRMEGHNVLFPIGWDAFGLPTENFAIKHNIHPAIVTKQNVDHFRMQLKRLGFSFDYSREVDTTDPAYYKWTQWIFLKLFEKGMVFRDKTLVNYCPTCKVVLSNEDSQGGKCDVCHGDVIQLPKDVWYLRITKYADKLLEGLKNVEYPENIAQQQVNWIGKSTGAFVDFTINGADEKLTIYTTRPDTLFGVTFMVMAPEHPMLDKYADRIANMDAIVAYREECAKKTEFERTQLVKDKTGLKIEGLCGVNPLTGKEVPIFISDYVMMGYGTGAIMAVPAHDERDYDFAKKFGIDIIEVIQGGNIAEAAYTGDGPMVNSDFLNAYDNKADSIAAMIEWLQEKGIGEGGVQFKMKDWAFNRQRYWGEPIPIVHCPCCGMVPVPYDELPLRLPPVTEFEPGQGGESPLAKLDYFVNCKCPKCGGDAKRETDTMPQWAGSSWYFLRYIDPKNSEALADMDKLRYWMPVDWYNGGMEHVTRHLIYSRFWHHFLYDLGLVPTAEPYAKRTAQGLILGPDGEKMSKSRGNVVDPNDVVDDMGADVLRVYILFMGDYGAAAPWSDNSMRGCKRFLERVADLPSLVKGGEGNAKLESSFHKTLKKVNSDIEEMKFNTAIAAMMGLLNEVFEVGSITKDQLSMFVRMLCPFAPHLCEEMWENMGGKGFASMAQWPEYDEAKTIDSTIELAVQINGKVRGKVTLPMNADKDTALAAVRADEKLFALIDGKTVVKEIVVPNKIINIVVK